MTAQNAATWALRMMESMRAEEGVLRRAWYDQDQARRELAKFGDQLMDRQVPVIPTELANLIRASDHERASNLAFFVDDLLQRRLWQRTRITYDVDLELWNVLGEMADSDTIYPNVFGYLPHPNPFIAFPEPLLVPLENEDVQHVVGMLVTGHRSEPLPVGDGVQLANVRCSSDEPGSVGPALLFYGPVYRGGTINKLPGGAIDCVFSRVGVRFDGNASMTFRAMLDGIHARFPISMSAMMTDQPVTEVWPAAEQMLRRALAILVYVCATNADIERAPAKAALGAVRNVAGETPGSTPRPPKVYEIGYRVGRALFDARREHESNPVPADSTGRKVAPHVRSAHFHTFLCGKGRQERRVKWLPPIAINMSGDLETMSVRPVRKKESRK